VDINAPANFDTFSHFWSDENNSFKPNTLIKKEEGNWIVNPEVYKDMPEILQTKYESYVIVPFVPTSEQLSRWMYDVMTSLMLSTGVKVHKIEWYETPKSRATYYG
jgi:6-pyruvoyltetrahydropterin/6-carboxytetrahydropterin synthase